jgi:hypothetical protein
MSFFQQYSQVYLHPQGMAYYKEGTTLLENGNYYEAEKSLTIALNSLKDENVYIKRGIARLYQEDTIGFCEDMNMAANKYFNLQASLLFNKSCCKKVDTVHYNKYFQVSNSSDFRYFEEIKDMKFKDEIIGILHDTRVKKEKFNIEYGRDQSNLGKNFLPEESHTLETNDIIAVYEEMDSVKKYLVCTNPPKIMNLTKYNFTKNKLKKMIKNHFYNLKVEKNADLTIYFELYINTKGEINKVKVIGTYPEVDFSQFDDDLEQYFSEIAKEYPPIKPAIFQGKPVNFIALDYVTF